MPYASVVSVVMAHDREIISQLGRVQATTRNSFLSEASSFRSMILPIPTGGGLSNFL